MISKRRFRTQTICYQASIIVFLVVFLCHIGTAKPEATDQPDPIVYSDAEIAWLQANHTVRIRLGHFPPLMFDDREEIRGIAIDTIGHIFRRNNRIYTH